MNEAYVWYEDGCSLWKCPEDHHIQHAPVPKAGHLVWIAVCELCGETFELVERGY